MNKLTEKFISKVWAARLLNCLLWIFFCAMTGTGLLLAFRLPPGSKGGQGLESLGFNRHEWGDFHTWLGYGFIVMILLHLGLHWRWLWQVAAWRRSWPILTGFSAGLGLLFWLVLLPVHRHGNGGHEPSPRASQVR